MKKIKCFLFLLSLCICDFVYASTTKYISCGGIDGIPYDIPGVVRAFIDIIMIFVPILLIILGAVDFTKVVFSNDDSAMKKSLSIFIKRMIAAVGVFFVIFLVQLLVKLIAVNTDGIMECISCFTSDESACVVYEVEDEDSTAEKEAADKAREELEQKREEIRLEKENEAGTNLDVSSGVNQGTFNGSTGKMNYWYSVPDNPKTNMPLVIFLHGSGECGSINSMINVSFPKYMYNGDFDQYDAFFLAPNTSSCNWVTDQKVLKELIDDFVEKYDIDQSRISITGHSLGAIGTWSIVSNYPTYFSAAVPISCCAPGGANAANFKTTPVRAYAGSAESNYISCMENFVNNINKNGGNAIYESVTGKNHSTVVEIYKTTDIINWMISQENPNIKN